MKKIIGLALAAVLMLSFAACAPSVTAPTSYSVIGSSEPIRHHRGSGLPLL